MSSFSRRTLLLMALPLASCGFAPAYGPGSAMAGLQGRVRVADPGDKNGFDLVERLEENLGRPAPALYDLTYSISTETDAVGITPEGAITRYTLTGQVTWALIRRADQTRVTGGVVDSFTAYSATGSTVAGLAAEEDAGLRLMRILADQIVTQLIATLRQLDAMKLAGAEASRYLAKPDPARAGLLIYGADPMRVALKRAAAVLALIGTEGESEMRLARMSGADLRKDGTLLRDAIKSVGFFPGPRLAFVEEASDGITDSVAAALKDWKPGDAGILVTAGALTAKSALKTLFEKHLNAVAIGLYDDPPTREEVEAELARAGLTNLDRDATSEIFTLSRALDPGDFRQTLEKLSLYKHADPTPLTAAEVTTLAPATAEADVLDLVHAAVEGKAAELGLILRRLEAQGTLPVTICIQTLRYIRALHATATSPDTGYPNRTAGFGPRRANMERQAKTWGTRPLESAMALLVETDLTLRSTSKAPAMALMERALIRLAMLRRG